LLLLFTLFVIKTLLTRNDTYKAGLFHVFFAAEALPFILTEVSNTLINASHIFLTFTFSSRERHLSAGINFDLQNVVKFVS
jgi:hypothetical protein